MLPDIDSLALFVQAAELRSLTKAAAASHIGLAAASRRIMLLEDRFSATLFDRSPRGMELTPAGISLLRHAKVLLMEMNQMQSVMKDHAAGRKGALRILANSSAIAESLPEDLAAFSKANPAVSLGLEERWSEEIVRSLLAAEADLGIIVEGIRTEGLSTYPYRRDRLAAVVPAGHPLETNAAFQFVDVLDHDVVALESGSSMMRLLAEQAVVANKTLQLRVQVRSFEAVCRMVQAGLGVGVLPLQAASPLAKGLGLAVRPFPEEWAERTMLACVKKDGVTNALLSKLLDHLTALGLSARSSIN